MSGFKLKQLRAMAAPDDELTKWRRLLKQGALPDGTGKFQPSPLHQAASQGRVEACRLLLNTGAWVDQPDSRGQTPLHAAVIGRNPKSAEVCSLLLEREASVDAKDKGGWTALKHAVFYENTGALRQLLTRAKSVDDPDMHGYTLLMLAVRRGSIEMTRTLLEAGANPLAKDASGHGVMHSAAEAGNVQIVELLSRLGVSVKDADQDGRTPLHIAAHRNDEDMCRILVQFGSDLEAQDQDGHTPLHHAVHESAHRSASALLEMGANALHRRKDGSVLFHLAAMNGSLTMMELLHRSGVPIDVQDEDARTALHAVAQVAQLGCLEQNNGTFVHIEGGACGWLIRRGADIDAVDHEAHSPLSVALLNGHRDMALFLIAHGAKKIRNVRVPAHCQDLVEWDHRVESDSLEVGQIPRIDSGKPRVTPLQAATLGNWCQRLSELLGTVSSMSARSVDGDDSRNDPKALKLLAIQKGHNNAAALLDAAIAQQRLRKMMGTIPPSPSTSA